MSIQVQNIFLHFYELVFIREIVY